MKVKFNFNLSAWMTDVEIEAKTLEEAERKLQSMSAYAIIQAGYDNNTDIEDIESKIVERDIKVKVHRVKYYILDSEFEAQGIDPDDIEATDAYEESLPQEFEFTLTDVAVGQEDAAIADAITDKTGWMVDDQSSEYEEIIY